MYTARNFDTLLGTPGFSDKLLTTHFTLYQGYVTNINKLVDELKTLAIDGKYAVYHSAGHGAAFGTGDLRTCDKTNNTSHLGGSYNAGGQPAAYLAGKSCFSLTEVEVYTPRMCVIL